MGVPAIKDLLEELSSECRVGTGAQIVEDEDLRLNPLVDVRIPRDGDQRSELMSIRIPK